MTSASSDLDRRGNKLPRFGAVLLLAIAVLEGCAGGPPPSSEREVSPKVSGVLSTIASQRGDDPLIGLWNATTAGFSWSVAIIKEDDLSRGYMFKGLMIKPWSSFAEGEEVLYLKRSSVPGVYEGTQKWKDALGFSSWSPARVVTQGDNLFTQYNSVRSRPFIPTTWVYLREATPGEEAARKTGRGGSGFLLRGSPLVLTSHHVVQGAEEVRVIFQGQEHVAKL